MASSPKPPWQMSMLSDTGRIRLRNEDHVFSDEERGLAVLADGMGGHAGGALAARLAVAAWVGEVGTGALDEALILRAVEAANRAVFETACQDKALRGMGTTLVAVGFRTDGTLVACHVGDSRLYRLRDDVLYCMTRDHSVLREQVDAGMIQSESEGDPLFRGLLTRAVGVESEVCPDLLVTRMEDGDVYLLCSDGLTEMLGDADIADVLTGLGAIPRLAAEHLVDMANDQGGTDNVSVVIVSLRAEGRPSAVVA